MASSTRAGRRVVFFPFPFQGHFNPVLRLASALHARGLEVTVFHTNFHSPDPADYPADYRFVSVPVEVPQELVASEDIARLVTTMNASCEAPFKDRLAALLAEGEQGGGVRCVITDAVWYSAQVATRELGVPALGIMTTSAVNFRVYMAYDTLIDKGYLPVQEARKDDPVDELPPLRVRDLPRPRNRRSPSTIAVAPLAVAEHPHGPSSSVTPTRGPSTWPPRRPTLRRDQPARPTGHRARPHQVAATRPSPPDLAQLPPPRAAHPLARSRRLPSSGIPVAAVRRRRAPPHPGPSPAVPAAGTPDLPPASPDPATRAVDLTVSDRRAPMERAAASSTKEYFFSVVQTLKRSGNFCGAGE